MPRGYKCRKCGATYSADDLFQSVFCPNCGTYLQQVTLASERLPKNNAHKLPKEFLATGKNKEKQDLAFEFEERNLAGENTAHKYLVNFSDPHNISKLIENQQYSSFREFLLNLKAQEIKNIGRIDKLVALDILRTRLTAYNFQMEVALQVMNEMNGTAILADEVGLGKTIEAGLIMKELLLRQEIASVLIVTPKSLLTQWKTEMVEKFGEAFLIANDPRELVDFVQDDRVICSHGVLARKYQHLANRVWDLVIVDEAHTFRNTRSKGRAYLAKLRKNHLLLLTATPLCNKLTDLYSLVDLVYPGKLDSERVFISRYAEDSKCRVIKSSMVRNLRSVLGELMCRTRRDQTGIPFTKRFVESRSLEANTQEQVFIELATRYLRDIVNDRYKTIQQLRHENPLRRSISESQSRAILVFQAISMQQSFSSSPAAAIDSLTKRGNKFPQEREVTSKLVEMASKIESSKIRLLEKVLSEIRDEGKNEQAVIFCNRKVTTEIIKSKLNQEFGRAAVYSGELSHRERDTVLNAFRDGAIRYLVATDAAAEGLNLQNCSLMFNYDLHWNPMKIEQRIGRIHRFKQERDVTIFNLALKDTIDDYVLHILYQKIELFTMTIGKMETILAEMKHGSDDIRKTIMDILLRSETKLDIKRELEKLANDINASRKRQELSEQFTKGVLN